MADIASLIKALKDKAVAQYDKGAPYRDALVSALRGDTGGVNQALSKSDLTPMDFALMMGVNGVGGKIPKTQFEMAHELAQQRATLPISEGGLGLHPQNTAMERAYAMGAEPAYHGTAETGNYRSIDPSKLGSATQSLSAKKAFWAVDDPTTAEGYANHAAMDAKVQKIIDMSDEAERKGKYNLSEKLMNDAQKLEENFANNQNQGQNIMPLMIMNKNQAKIDAGGNTFMDMQDEMHNLLNNAIESNYPSVKISNLSDEIDWGRYNPATHYGVVDPSVVRSRFAAFDPFRRNENDIMAGVGAGALPFVDYNKKK